MKAFHIAPCGMNCALCLAYIRNKNRCEGCRSGDENKPVYCIKCIIKNCGARPENGDDFCYVCEKYPCARLKALDKRYRTKYSMSMLENLSQIRDGGIETFLAAQRKKWSCKSCGETICVHRGVCLKCGN